MRRDTKEKKREKGVKAENRIKRKCNLGIGWQKRAIESKKLLFFVVTLFGKFSNWVREGFKLALCRIRSITFLYMYLYILGEYEVQYPWAAEHRRHEGRCASHPAEACYGQRVDQSINQSLCCRPIVQPTSFILQSRDLPWTTSRSIYQSINHYVVDQSFSQRRSSNKADLP